jgi:cation diffusion facilitator family transporter
MDSSRRSIYAALAGNVGVALVKFAAFFFSGSASMLVEGFHSVIDTVNQALLLLGTHLSDRPADDKHPFGYGMESFFWSFVVGMLIFVAGGVASLYEGYEQLIHPEPLRHVPLSLGVLAIAFVLEGLSFLASLRESERGRPPLTRKRYRRVSLYQYIHFSPDPAVFEVLAEGAASLLGLILAAFGVIGGALFGWHEADGAAAIAIGILLMALAGVVLAESKSLLTGEAVSPTILDGVRKILSADPRIARVDEILSLYFGPDEILLAARLKFKRDLPAHQIDQVAADLLRRLKDAEPRISRLFLRAGDEG